MEFLLVRIRIVGLHSQECKGEGLVYIHVGEGLVFYSTYLIHRPEVKIECFPSYRRLTSQIPFALPSQSSCFAPVKSLLKPLFIDSVELFHNIQTFVFVFTSEGKNMKERTLFVHHPLGFWKRKRSLSASGSQILILKGIFHEVGLLFLALAIVVIRSALRPCILPLQGREGMRENR